MESNKILCCFSLFFLTALCAYSQNDASLKTDAQAGRSIAVDKANADQWLHTLIFIDGTQKQRSPEAYKYLQSKKLEFYDVKIHAADIRKITKDTAVTRIIFLRTKNKILEN